MAECEGRRSFQVPNGKEKGGGDSRWLGERGETDSGGEIFQNVGGNGNRSTEGQPESVLGNRTNGLHRRRRWATKLRADLEVLD